MKKNVTSKMSWKFIFILVSILSFTSCKKFELPKVTTAEPVMVNDSTYVCGGDVTSQGGRPVTERGVVVSLSADPEINNENSVKVEIGSGTGVFSGPLDPFYAGYTYYVRAYAINQNGVAYGETKIVTPGGTPTGCTVVNVTGGISTPTTWTSGNVYMITGTVTVTSVLTIQPGVIIKSSGNNVNGTFDVQSGGRIIANGTPNNRIVFTSRYDDSYCGDSNGDGNATTPNKGDWNDIELDGGTESEFSYCDFLYGGSYNGYVIFVGVSSPAFTFDNCTFAHTKNSTTDYAAFHGGSYMIDNTISKLTNCAFYNNDRPLYCNTYYTVSTTNKFHNPANPSQKNLRNGIFLWHGADPANHVVSFNVTEVPYVLLSQFTGGGSGATGTVNIPSGAILKFTSPSIGIARAAGRTVNLSSGAILTSYKDDANGGDTNGDGSASSPTMGDWQGFWNYNNNTWVTGSNILYAAD